MSRSPRFRAIAAGRPAKAGFVLVEMLVAMAVGAFLLVALASLTAFLLRTHDRLLAQAQEAEDAGRALAALSRDIGRAAHVRWAGRGNGFVFSGTPNRLVLARSVPGADGLGGMTAILLRIGSTKTGTELSRAESVLLPAAAAPDALAWGPPASLYAGPSRIAFAYFMRLDTGGEALLDDWLPGDEMPVAVRVSFVPPGAGMPALSLRIPLLIDTEPACAVPDAEACAKPAAGEGEGDDAASAGTVDAEDAMGWSRYAR